jgi:hypothetical protein
MQRHIAKLGKATIYGCLENTDECQVLLSKSSYSLIPFRLNQIKVKLFCSDRI